MSDGDQRGMSALEPYLSELGLDPERLSALNNGDLPELILPLLASQLPRSLLLALVLLLEPDPTMDVGAVLLRQLGPAPSVCPLCAGRGQLSPHEVTHGL